MQGIVGYQDVLLTENQIAGYIAAYSSRGGAQKNARPSVRCCLRASPNSHQPASSQNSEDGMEFYQKLVEQLSDLQKQASEEGCGSRLRIDGFKLMLDGVIEEGTAALLPHDSLPSAHAASAAAPCCDLLESKLIWTNEQLSAMIHAALQSQLVKTLHFHAIGDAAAKQVSTTRA